VLCQDGVTDDTCRCVDVGLEDAAEGVVDAGVVVPAAQAPRRELAVGEAEDLGEKVHPLREGVEDILATERQPHVIGQRDARL